MIFQIPSANTKVYQWAPSFKQSFNLGPIHQSRRWYVSRTTSTFVGSKWSLRNVGFVSGFIKVLSFLFSYIGRISCLESIVGVLSLVSIPCNLYDVNQHEVLTCHFKCVKLFQFDVKRFQKSHSLWNDGVPHVVYNTPL